MPLRVWVHHHNKLHHRKCRPTRTSPQQPPERKRGLVPRGGGFAGFHRRPRPRLVAPLLVRLSTAENMRWGASVARAAPPAGRVGAERRIRRLQTLHWCSHRRLTLCVYVFGLGEGEVGVEVEHPLTLQLKREPTLKTRTCPLRKCVTRWHGSRIGDGYKCSGRRVRFESRAAIPNTSPSVPLARSVDAQQAMDTAYGSKQDDGIHFHHGRRSLMRNRKQNVHQLRGKRNRGAPSGAPSVRLG